MQFLKLYMCKENVCTRASQVMITITAFTSWRTNLSPFTKGCREWDAAMWLSNFCGASLPQRKSKSMFWSDVCASLKLAAAESAQIKIVFVLTKTATHTYTANMSRMSLIPVQHSLLIESGWGITFLGDKNCWMKFKISEWWPENRTCFITFDWWIKNFFM